MDIAFKGRHTNVQERFREHATVKLAKLEKLLRKVIRIDVEVSKESNPRLYGRRERVELTIRIPRARDPGRSRRGRQVRRA